MGLCSYCFNEAVLGSCAFCRGFVLRSGPAEFVSAAVAIATVLWRSPNCACYLIGSAVQLVISVRGGWSSAVGAGAMNLLSSGAGANQGWRATDPENMKKDFSLPTTNWPPLPSIWALMRRLSVEVRKKISVPFLFHWGFVPPSRETCHLPAGLGKLTTYISIRPDSSDEYATHLPSGENAGLALLNGVCTSEKGLRSPSSGIAQIPFPRLSSLG